MRAMKFELNGARCPNCGGQPTVLPEMDGYAYSAECSKCGWNGGYVSMELTASGAIDAWFEKAEREKEVAFK